MKPRYLVVVPTYNNPKTIEEVVQECLDECTHPILVVDDGSVPPVSLPANPRLTIFRHEKNLGKGRAIQNAFRLGIEGGFTHIVTVDGDGQHLGHELPKLIRESMLHPWGLVIGERKFSGEHVPEISKFGRKFSNFWVKFETSKPVKDSQSGFRIYPLFHVQNTKFWTKRFDFEIEVLIRLMWNEVEVREVPIDVHYPPPHERVSHFDKLWDNVRISFLNAALVTISLLRVPESPLKISVAVALGAAVGTYPVFGFHSIIAAGLALALRLNFIALVLGTQVSVPPMIPIIFLLVHKIDQHIPLPHRWMRVGTSFVILSVVFAVIAFIATFIVTSVIQKRKAEAPKSAWSGKTRGGAIGNGFMKVMLKIGGLPLAYFLIAWAIPYFYLFAPTARSSLNQYWKNIAPEVGFFRRQGKILLHFYRFAQVLLDRAFQEHQEKAFFKINSSGSENILGPVNAQKGIIMVTAHVGAWDLASFVLRKKNGGSDFRMVKFEAEGLTYDKASGKSETEQKHHLVHQAKPEEQGGLIFQIRDLLQSGRPVGLMGDRPISHQIELVKFMGKLAVWDITPMRVAKICKVPMVATFGFKGKPGEYDFYAHEAVMVQDPYSAALLYCSQLEDHLKKYPEQWFNFFPFWSNVPFALKISSHHIAPPH